MATTLPFVDAAIPRMVAKKRPLPFRAPRHRPCSGTEPTMASRPLLIALLVAGLPATAAAEPVLDGSEIKFEWNLVEEDGSFTPVSENDTDYLWERQFNLARCKCGSADTANTDRRLQFGVQFTFDPALTSTVTDTVHVWLGVDCLDADPTIRKCGETPQHEFGDADDISESPQVPFNVYELHNAEIGRASCR